MPMSAKDYAVISDLARQIVASGENPNATAYALMRASLLVILHQAGAEHAAEICYQLGDEMVGCGK